MLGVVESIPIRSLANVPEFPKFKIVFFFAVKEPSPFPKTFYFPSDILFIFIPKFLRQFIVDPTSSDSKTLSNSEIL